MITPYYQDSLCTIYHGDCREILPQLEPVDLVLTDPPYGIAEAAGKNKSRSNLAVAKDYGVSDWDNYLVDSSLLLLAMGLSKNSIIFGGNYYADILAASTCWLAWDKDNGQSDFADCELAWTSLPGAVRRLKYTWNGMIKQQPEERWHPTQKPLTVMRWCIEQADHKTKKTQETILDPFMGSGTTLVAAKQLGRKAVGIERELKYCEVAKNRLRQESLFSQAKA